MAEVQSGELPYAMDAALKRQKGQKKKKKHTLNKDTYVIKIKERRKKIYPWQNIYQKKASTAISLLNKLEIKAKNIML